MTTLYCHNTTKHGYFETPFFEFHRIMKCHNAETIQNVFWTRRQQLKKMPMLHLFAVYVTLKTISVFFKMKTLLLQQILCQTASSGFLVNFRIITSQCKETLLVNELLE